MKKEELYPIQFLSNIHHRLVDCIFGKDAQNVLTTGVNDTMMDMILASLGSLTFVITYIFEEFNNKKLIVKNFVEQL